MEGVLTLANGQTTTVTPGGGTLTTGVAGGVSVLDVIQTSALVVNGNWPYPKNSEIVTGGDGFGGTGPGGNSLSVSGTLSIPDGAIVMTGVGDSVSANALTTAGAIQFDNANETLAVSSALVEQRQYPAGKLEQ